MVVTVIAVDETCDKKKIMLVDYLGTDKKAELCQIYVRKYLHKLRSYTSLVVQVCSRQTLPTTVTDIPSSTTSPRMHRT